MEGASWDEHLPLTTLARWLGGTGSGKVGWAGEAQAQFPSNHSPSHILAGPAPQLAPPLSALLPINHPPHPHPARLHVLPKARWAWVWIKVKYD